MTARRHMLEEFSNQPFVIERAGAGSEADGTSGLVVTGLTFHGAGLPWTSRARQLRWSVGERRLSIASLKAS